MFASVRRKKCALIGFVRFLPKPFPPHHLWYHIYCKILSLVVMASALFGPIVVARAGVTVACENGSAKQMPMQICTQGVSWGNSSPYLVLNITTFETTCHWLKTQTLIGYLVGHIPLESMLHEWITKAWTSQGIHLEGIQSLTKGFFLFHFDSPTQAEGIFKHGPCTICLFLLVF